jgi:hypothetical protein
MVCDPEFANGIGQTETAVAEPGDPVADAPSQLLYDHLAFVQGEALERRGTRLAIDVKDDDSLILQLVASRVLEL